MLLKDWVDESRGRGSALARHFNITPSAVNQWIDNGVPKHRMSDVEAFTGGDVTIKDMASHAVERIISRATQQTNQ